jgi:hypothetical protein
VILLEYTLYLSGSLTYVDAPEGTLFSRSDCHLERMSSMLSRVIVEMKLRRSTKRQTEVISGTSGLAILLLRIQNQI